jgi:phosphotransferase system enzyme I (PtsI)
MASRLNNGPRRLQGIGVSEGIAHGKVFLLERERISIPHRSIAAEETTAEAARFREALARTRSGLQAIKSAMLAADSREPAFIIDAHMMMLEDDLLVQGTVDLIEKERVNAEWALRRKTAELVATFTRMTDPYLRERGRDVEEVSERVIGELVGRTESPLTHVEGPVIVVAHDLSPAETAHLALDKVMAFATDIGSLTSHTAIVAKSLNIPAVVGLKTVTQQVAHGDTILIDGHAGRVIVNPHPDTVEEFESRRQWLADLRQSLRRYRDLPSETADGHRVRLAANLEIIDEIRYLKESGAEGVGLYRTEYLYLDREDLPSEDEHFESYRQLAEATHPHGATIRTLDLGGDKFKSDLTVSEELNPAMGLRAIRLCLNRPDLFKTQLRAILRASAFGKVRVMFPMISGFQEFRDAKRLLYEAAAELEAKGIVFDREIEIGVMIEIPSAAMIAEELAQAADFFSIGTNDLIQYTLAIDRINEHVSYLYQPLHPAVLRIVRQVVLAGHKYGIPVDMCGAMAAEPIYLPVLLGLELDELSMPMSAILRIKRILRSLRQEDAKRLVDELYHYRTAQEIRERVRQEIRSRWTESFALEREAFEEDDSPTVG